MRRICASEYKHACASNSGCHNHTLLPSLAHLHSLQSLGARQRTPYPALTARQCTCSLQGTAGLLIMPHPSQCSADSDSTEKQEHPVMTLLKIACSPINSWPEQQAQQQGQIPTVHYRTVNELSDRMERGEKVTPSTPPVRDTVRYRAPNRSLLQKQQTFRPFTRVQYVSVRSKTHPSCYSTISSTVL